jgi:eukaryotic-like serine/threonine-protein kinase
MNEEVVAEGDLLHQRYRILGRLATGGMSSVWRAGDEVLGRTVAVKVLDCRLLDDADSRARMRDEAKVLARVNHPRIASVYDYGLVGEVPYLVMELVEGVTLAGLISRPGSMPWQLAVRICAQVAEALAAAHERGLVHRDISAANVLWTRDGVKVIDFGLCAAEGEPEESEELVGTPAYMAPERIDGGTVRPASDVYALGIMLYRTLADRLPWEVESVVQLLGAHRHLPPASMHAEGVPAAVARICERCLAKDPADRPSAADVARTLSAALQIDSEDPIEAPTSPTMLDRPLQTVAVLRKKNRVPRPVAAGAAAIALVAATGLATTWASHATPQAASADDTVSSATGDCHVDYKITYDDGERFDATINVRNTSTTAYEGWRLVFGLPGAQSVDPAQSSTWIERDGIVTSRSQPEALVPGDDTQLAFAGRYADANPFPTKFLLDTHLCSASLLGITGHTVVPVTVVTTPQETAGQQTESGSEDGDHHGDEGNDEEKGKGKD